MEILCPRCGKRLPVADSFQNAVCPYCRSELSVAEQGDGFVIITAENEPPCPNKNFVNDDVTDDYIKWQVASIFCIIFGIVISVVIGIQTFRDYKLGGLLYLAKQSNLLFIGIAGFISVCMVIAGAVLYRYISGQKKNYISGI